MRCFDAFEFQGHFCIALELLGRNLYELLEGGLRAELVEEATRQVLMALDYLEGCEVIHGDLKPENVLVEKKWPAIWPWKVPSKVHFKVIDFGAARKLGEAEVTIQTLPYRAPEVLLGLPVSCAADLWSLGCLCVELFVGEPLFPHEGDKDDMLQAMLLLLGEVPEHMLEQGQKTKEFFEARKTWLHAFRALFWPQPAVYRLRWLQKSSQLLFILSTLYDIYLIPIPIFYATDLFESSRSLRGPAAAAWVLPP